MVTSIAIVLLVLLILINPITHLALNEHKDWDKCPCTDCMMEEIEHQMGNHRKTGESTQ